MEDNQIAIGDPSFEALATGARASATGEGVVTFDTTGGGDGPSTGKQNSWFRVQIGSGTYYLPLWQ